MPERMGMNKEDTKNLVFLMNKKQGMLGYNKKEQKELNIRAMKHEKNADMVRQTYHTLEKFTIFNLYLKLDASSEKLKEFEDIVAGALAGYEEGTVSILDLKDVSNTHVFIDEYVLRLSYRTKMKIARAKVVKNAHEALVLRNCVNGAFGAWFSIAVYSMSDIGYTDEEIKIVMDSIIEHIENYSNGLMTDSDVDMTLEILEEETGYRAKAMEGIAF